MEPITKEQAAELLAMIEKLKSEVASQGERIAKLEQAAADANKRGPLFEKDGSQ